MPPPIGTSNPSEPLLPVVNGSIHQSAFRPVIRVPPIVETSIQESTVEIPPNKEENSDDEVDIETTEDDISSPLNVSLQNLNSTSNSAISNHSGNSTSPKCWSPPQETVSYSNTSLFNLILTYQTYLRTDSDELKLCLGDNC